MEKQIELTYGYKHIFPKVKGRIVNMNGHFIHLEFRVFKRPLFLGFMRKPRWYSYEYTVPPIPGSPINIFVDKRKITIKINP